MSLLVALRGRLLLTGGLVVGVACVVFRWRRPRHDKMKRTVLVTGACSGLGLAFCRRCIHGGDRVVALDMDGQGLSSLVQEFGDAVLALEANVGCEASLAHAVSKTCQFLGEGGIDAICNFAGVIRGGPLLELDDADLDLVFRVNVLGTCRVNKSFFPLLNRGSEARPRIINVASEVSHARLSVAFNAPYAMSKIAVEAMSVALRQELRMLQGARVLVIVVVPGAVNTPLIREQLPGGPNAFFERHAQRPETLWRAPLLRGAVLAQDYMSRHATDPGRVANVVYEALHCTAPPERVLINVSQQMRICRCLPQWLLDVSILQKVGVSSGRQHSV